MHQCLPVIIKNSMNSSISFGQICSCSYRKCTLSFNVWQFLTLQEKNSTVFLLSAFISQLKLRFSANKCFAKVEASDQLFLQAFICSFFFWFVWFILLYKCRTLVYRHHFCQRQEKPKKEKPTRGYIMLF